MMRLLRLLGLVPVLIGAAVVVIAGDRASEAELKLCGFAKGLLGKLGFAQSFINLPDACFFGAPTWAPYAAAAGCIVAGILWLYWPEQRADAARLRIAGPRLHQYPPHKTHTTHFCRMRIHNRGPAIAHNVQIRLVNIVPRPRHASWAADYPYPVARAGHPIEAPGCELSRGADVLFQVASAWKNSRGQFLAGLDTKSGFHNPTPIEPDERWEMTYEVTADNAKPLKFLLEMLIQGDAVAMKRRS